MEEKTDLVSTSKLLGLERAVWFRNCSLYILQLEVWGSSILQDLGLIKTVALPLIKSTKPAVFGVYFFTGAKSAASVNMFSPIRSISNSSLGAKPASLKTRCLAHLFLLYVIFSPSSVSSFTLLLLVKTHFPMQCNRVNFVD